MATEGGRVFVFGLEQERGEMYGVVLGDWAAEILRAPSTGLRTQTLKPFPMPQLHTESRARTSPSHGPITHLVSSTELGMFWLAQSVHSLERARRRFASQAPSRRMHTCSTRSLSSRHQALAQGDKVILVCPLYFIADYPYSINCGEEGEEGGGGG
jgi:hypothetical protein